METKTTIVFAENVMENEQGTFVKNPFGTLKLAGLPSNYSFSSHIVVSDLPTEEDARIVFRMLDANGDLLMETTELHIEQANRTDNVNINLRFDNLLLKKAGYYSLEVTVNGEKVGENDFRIEVAEPASNIHLLGSK